MRCPVELSSVQSPSPTPGSARVDSPHAAVRTQTSLVSAATTSVRQGRRAVRTRATSTAAAVSRSSLTLCPLARRCPWRTGRADSLITAVDLALGTWAPLRKMPSSRRHTVDKPPLMSAPPSIDRCPTPRTGSKFLRTKFKRRGFRDEHSLWPLVVANMTSTDVLADPDRGWRIRSAAGRLVYRVIRGPVAQWSRTRRVDGVFHALAV